MLATPLNDSVDPDMIPKSRHPNPCGGFTLSEVMITLLLTAMMCLAVFAGLQTTSKLSLGTAVRSEAHRLLQAEAERLSSVEFASFVASADQSISSSFKTTFLAGNEAQFSYPSSSSPGRVIFTKRVVAVASTSTSRTLRIEVEWTWQGRSSQISIPMFRTQ